MNLSLARISELVGNHSTGEVVPLIRGRGLSPQDLRELSTLDNYLSGAQIQVRTRTTNGSEHLRSMLYIANEPEYGPTIFVFQDGSHAEHMRLSELVKGLTGGRHIPAGTIILQRKLTGSMIANYVERLSAEIDDTSGVDIICVEYRGVPKPAYENSAVPKDRLVVQHS